MQFKACILFLVLQCTHATLRINIREAKECFTANFNITLDTEEEFEIMNPIGSGAVGQVQRVKHLETGKMFAVKSASRSGVDHFVDNEWDISLQMTFPTDGIIDIQAAGYAWGDIEGIVLLMEIVESQNLEALGYKTGSKNKEKIPLKNIIKAGSDIVETLDYLREKGITHRDLKWNNIVFRGPKAVVLDFGVAFSEQVNVLQISKRYGSYTGMSPNIHRGDVPWPKDDLWSLIIILVQSQNNGETPWDKEAGSLRWLERKNYRSFLDVNKKLAADKENFVDGLERLNLPKELLTVLVAIRKHLRRQDGANDYSAIKIAFKTVLDAMA